MNREAKRSNDDREGPEPSPSLSLKRPPIPLSSSAGKAQMDYVLFENLPRGILTSDGESSVLSLPNVPSPLSERPPSTVHTDDEIRNLSSLRRRDVMGNDEGDTFYDDRSLEHRIQCTLNHAPQPIQIDTPSSVPITPVGLTMKRNQWNQENTPWSNSDLEDNKIISHRSAMAILKLKQDLRNAVNNLYLMKQEKETAELIAHDLKRSHDQLLQEKRVAEERADASEKDRRTSEHIKHDLSIELKNKHTELQKIMAEKSEADSEAQQLKKEVESLKSENLELSSRMRHLIREHQDDLDSFRKSTAERLNCPKNELDLVLKENDTLKRSLAESNNKHAESTKELEQEKVKSQADVVAMAERHDTCLQEIERLESLVEEAKMKSNEHIQNLEMKNQELKSKQEANQVEIICLRNALKEAGKESDKASGDSAKVEAEITSLKLMNETQGKQIEQMTTAMQEASDGLEQRVGELRQAQDEVNKIKAENQTHIHEIQRLGAALEEARRANNTRTTLKDAASQANLDGAPSAMTTMTQKYTTDCGDSILDRLSRIRDAAERAALVKDHQREISRIKTQYDSRIKNLTNRHEQNLEESLHATKLQLDTKHKEILEASQRDFESRIATINRRHQEEVEMLKDELTSSARNSDESLSAVMSELSAVKQRMERELAKREQLQDDVKQLEEQLASEKRSLAVRHADKIQSLKKSWEEETNDLLGVIQRECNLVFEVKRTSSNAASPRSVDFDFSSNNHSSNFHQYLQESHCSPKIKEVPTKATESFSYSKIDDDLRETEALVQSLLFGCQEGGET